MIEYKEGDQVKVAFTGRALRTCEIPGHTWMVQVTIDGSEQAHAWVPLSAVKLDKDEDEWEKALHDLAEALIGSWDGRVAEPATPLVSEFSDRP
jgi:hypothetical protein